MQKARPEALPMDPGGQGVRENQVQDASEAPGQEEARGTDAPQRTHAGSCSIN